MLEYRETKEVSNEVKQIIYERGFRAQNSFQYNKVNDTPRSTIKV